MLSTPKLANKTRITQLEKPTKQMKRSEINY